MFIPEIKKIIVVLSINLICLLGFTIQAQAALPVNFQDEAVLTGLNQPLNLTSLPDGRMLVLMKGGEIRIFDPSTVPATSTSYLTITDINSNEERGLASIVLDPDFATNNYFYVYYTHGSSARNRIARFTHAGNTASLASEVLIWQNVNVWTDCCHYGGGLDFGPDGRLYLATGEEFGGGQSQDLTLAGGKVIRVNKDGTIPADNPFYDGAGPNLDEIWALGFRNPYRAKWDLLSNRFFIGDVGGNVTSTAREEVNLGQAGRNYGWPAGGEGVLNNPAYEDPIYDYGHTLPTPNGGAITSGMVYRGNMYPSQYYGSYFFADYALGTISYLDFDINGLVIGATEFTNTVSNVVSLVEGPDGALYYTDIAGQVRRIVYTGGNQPPAITAVSATPASGPSPLNVTLNVSVTDPEGDPLTYRWVFGDGVEADGGASISHAYPEGVFTAYVLVSDAGKTSTSAPVAIESGNPPQVTIAAPTPGSLFRALDTVNFSGSAADPDETLLESNYSWTVRFLHDTHTHPVITDAIGSSGSFQVSDSGHDYFGTTGYELILTATDSAGLTGTARIEIYPDKVNLNLATSPAGQNVFVDGQSQATPVAYDTMIGFRHTVSAPDSFCDVPADTVYTFSSWSDGGAQTHEITVPAVDMNLTANYVANGTCSNLTTAGLALQLEVDQGITLSGSTVTGWVDQSGFGNNLVSVG
ncbi:MAG: PQQ-dependent sugar dehydrogenase, partial [Gammaproteobacteria bacterium]